MKTVKVAKHQQAEILQWKMTTRYFYCRPTFLYYVNFYFIYISLASGNGLGVCNSNQLSIYGAKTSLIESGILHRKKTDRINMLQLAFLKLFPLAKNKTRGDNL